jgi:hypothetical protein
MSRLGFMQNYTPWRAPRNGEALVPSRWLSGP